jgi:prophage regulatory protein
MLLVEEFITMAGLVGRPATQEHAAEPGVIPVSKGTIRRWVREGKFPPPFRLGEARVGWRVSDIEQWQDTRSVASWAENGERS